MKITGIDASVRRFPTPVPEADGTFEWDATTVVVVQAHAEDVTGLGWTYSSPAAAVVARDHLADVVTGRDLDELGACWEDMRRACRNIGTRGLVMQAISAVDVALWDLQARASDVPLTDLLGAVRDDVPVYGSGGFTTLSDDELREQVAGWAAEGCRAMKIKIGEAWGTRPERDLHRVGVLRDAAGPGVTLMADANGAYTRGQAERIGHELAELGVRWFEEPVTSDDLDGLALLRDVLPCDVTAGEYASDTYEVDALCRCLDCVQLDATRCGGYTGFLEAAALAAAHHLDVSAHCAPALHAPVAAAVPNLRHIEYFADHARLEPQLLDGVPPVVDGALHLTPTVGHGYTLRPEPER